MTFKYLMNRISELTKKIKVSNEWVNDSFGDKVFEDIKISEPEFGGFQMTNPPFNMKNARNIHTYCVRAIFGVFNEFDISKNNNIPRKVLMEHLASPICGLSITIGFGLIERIFRDNGYEGKFKQIIKKARVDKVISHHEKEYLWLTYIIRNALVHDNNMKDDSVLDEDIAKLYVTVDMSIMNRVLFIQDKIEKHFNYK